MSFYILIVEAMLFDAVGYEVDSLLVYLVVGKLGYFTKIL